MYRSPPEPVYESDDILSDDGSTFPLDLDDLGMLTVDPYDDQLSYAQDPAIIDPSWSNLSTSTSSSSNETNLGLLNPTATRAWATTTTAPPKRTNTLSPHEIRELYDIAMTSTFRPALQSTPPPSPPSSLSSEEDDASPQRKRLRCTAHETAALAHGHTGPNANGTRIPKSKSQTSHNVIEKRYRNNLNRKIEALRDSIPCFRRERDHDHDSKEDENDMEQRKCNKATVLGKAVEYIRQLEATAGSLRRERDGLLVRVGAGDEFYRERR